MKNIQWNDQIDHNKNKSYLQKSGKLNETIQD